MLEDAGVGRPTITRDIARPFSRVGEGAVISVAYGVIGGKPGRAAMRRVDRSDRRSNGTLNDVFAGPSVPWVRERDLDFVLAEEITASSPFAGWLARRAFRDKSPLGDPRRHVAVVNYSRPRSGPEGVGESDLLVELVWSEGPWGMLSIEDKVLASPQTRQGERHKAFVAEQGADLAAAILVAPRLWLQGHETEAGTYDAGIAIEDIARWLRDRTHLCDGTEARRLAWRAAVLGQATAQRNDAEAAPDLDAWTSDLDAVFARHGVRLDPYPRQRASKERGRPGRFIRFATGTLAATRGVDASLYVKCATAKFPGRVDLEIVRPGPEIGRRLEDAAKAEGFSVRSTKKGTLIIGIWPPSAAQLNMHQPVVAQADAASALAEAAATLASWYRTISPRLLGNEKAGLS
jgi:hypothetical protein